MSNLHNEIMNLQPGSEMSEENPARTVYKLGHRDARYAAAEKAIKYDAAVEILQEMLNDYKDACVEWTDDVQEYGLDLIERTEKVLSDMSK